MAKIVQIKINIGSTTPNFLTMPFSCSVQITYTSYPCLGCGPERQLLRTSCCSKHCCCVGVRGEVKLVLLRFSFSYMTKTNYCMSRLVKRLLPRLISVLLLILK